MGDGMLVRFLNLGTLKSPHEDLTDLSLLGRLLEVTKNPHRPLDLLFGRHRLRNNRHLSGIYSASAGARQFKLYQAHVRRVLCRVNLLKYPDYWYVVETHLIHLFLTCLLVLIVLRIWRVEREKSQFVYHTNATRSGGRSSHSHHSNSPLRNAMRIIIESGLIITLSSLISVITYVSGSNSVYATSDVVCLLHIYGILITHWIF